MLLAKWGNLSTIEMEKSFIIPISEVGDGPKTFPHQLVIQY